MKKTHALLYTLATLALPLATLADVGDASRAIPGPYTYTPDPCVGKITNLSGLIGRISCLAAPLIPLFMLLALLYFLWGAVQFIRSDDKTRDEARNKMLYGILGLFVMVAVWGLVNVISGTFNLNTAVPVAPTYPQ